MVSHSVYIKDSDGQFKLLATNPKFDNDPIILELREKYPKNGPDPEPGEDINHWAERYLEYVRKKYRLEERCPT